MDRNKKRFILISILYLSLTTVLEAQGNKYWIRFTNKTGTPYTVSSPNAFLSAKAIARRTAAGVQVNATDLPVTPSYISQIEAVPNVTVLYASKWINGVVAIITNTAALTTINSFSFVGTSFPVNRYRKDIGETGNDKLPVSTVQRSASSGFNYGLSLTQAQQLNVPCLHNAGFRGQGMTIAVLDNGFNNANVNPVFDSIRTRGGILGTYDFVNMEQNVYNDGAHGAMVLSTMAGLSPGNLVGTAPYANYWLFTTEDDGAETISEEYNWIRGAEFADSAGADILTTSLGYFNFDGNLNNHVTADLNGRTAPMSIAANLAARKGMVVLNSAGNSGSGVTTIGVPADADSIIAVGAVDGNGTRAGFSSVGPSADGRIKPDLSAMGQGAIVCQPNGSFTGANGTSFSCPILAGAVACFWQKHPGLTSFMVVDILKNNATQTSNPDNLLGWGIPNVCAVVGIKENEWSHKYKFELIPNPTEGIFRIRYNEAYQSELKGLTLHNALGQVILQQSYNQMQNDARLDISKEPAGVYFLTISVNEGIISRKLIKY